MVSWAAVHEQVPELAGAVRARFAARVHHVLGTVRPDGTPRLSGSEVRWWGEDLVLASMGGSWKSRDLAGDGRLALMSGSADPPDWTGDARITGRASQVTDPAAVAAFTGSLEQAPPGPFELFLVQVQELVQVTLSAEQDCLVITSWRAGRGLREVRRT